ncbi:MAG: DapH/DapD/GlmU-related protein [Pseudomonadota bacterium]
MSGTESEESYKVRDIGKAGRSRWRTYTELMTGESRFFALLKYELIVSFFGAVPGALGLALRKTFYPSILGSVGKNVVFGRNVIIRHGSKINIGSDVIFDDNCVIDAKGGPDSRITIGNGVFVGRNTIVYTKGGEIEIGDNVNIGVNCDIYSKNRVSIGENTMVAAYCYIMSGGQYDYQSETPFYQQNSSSRGPTEIGNSCWLGAKVTVQDNVTIGARAVVGAGAVVTKNIPEASVAIGVPARVR